MEHINIIGTIYDNSMSHTVAHASQIYDDVLSKKLDIINSELRRDVDIALNNLGGGQSVDLTEIQEDILSLKEIINNIGTPDDDQEYMYFVFLTQQQYDALEEYDQDTLYFIIENLSWVFGQEFPLTFTDSQSVTNLTT